MCKDLKVYRQSIHILWDLGLGLRTESEALQSFSVRREYFRFSPESKIPTAVASMLLPKKIQGSHNFPRGSIYLTIMELAPQNHNGDGLLGPNCIVVVYMDPLGLHDRRNLAHAFQIQTNLAGGRLGMTNVVPWTWTYHPKSSTLISSHGSCSIGQSSAWQPGDRCCPDTHSLGFGLAGKIENRLESSYC